MINKVLFELEISVGNESIDRNIELFQNVQPFQIQYSNFQNPPINQNSHNMDNVSLPQVVSQTQPTQEPMCQYQVLHGYFFNSSKRCNIIYFYHMIYNIFLLYHIIELKAYNLQLKQIQSTIFSLPFQSTLGDKIIIKFITD